MFDIATVKDKWDSKKRCVEGNDWGLVLAWTPKGKGGRETVEDVENRRVDGMVSHKEKKAGEEGVQAGHFGCLCALCMEGLISLPDARESQTIPTCINLGLLFKARVPWHILVQSCHGPYGSQENRSRLSSMGMLKE